MSGSHGRRPSQDSNTPYGGSGYCIPNFPTPEKEGKNRVFDALSSFEGKPKEAHPLPSPPPRTVLSIPTTQEKERESEKAWRIIALLTLPNPSTATVISGTGKGPKTDFPFSLPLPLFCAQKLGPLQTALLHKRGSVAACPLGQKGLSTRTRAMCIVQFMVCFQCVLNDPSFVSY